MAITFSNTIGSHPRRKTRPNSCIEIGNLYRERRHMTLRVLRR